MKSVRLGADLEIKLKRAADIAGVSESELIREGVEQRCEQVLGDTLAESLKHYIGVVSSGKHDSVDSERVFGEYVLQKQRREQRDWRKRRRSSPTLAHS